METVRQAPELHGIARPRWRLADLREAVPWLAGYSLPGISKALRRLRVSRQRGRLATHSPDPAYREKLAWVDRARTVALLPARRTVLLYGDELTFYRQPTLAPVYAPVGQAPVARCAAGANWRYRLAAALDWATGRVTYLGHDTIGIYYLKRFLRKLRRAYPGGRLLLAWDNWPVHQHEGVLAEAAGLGIEILWLPTYAPWTNPIEKVWRWLKQDVLHAHRLADDWAALKRRVRAWLDQFAGPSPELLHYVGELPGWGE